MTRFLHFSLLPLNAAENVQTPREVFDQLTSIGGYDLVYHRVPVTSGEAPETSDFDALVRIVCEPGNAENVCFVFNCQTGVGRSTIGQAVALLLLDWLGVIKISTEHTHTLLIDQYEVVVSLLRVIRFAGEAKKKVDAVIEMCASMVHLRDVIADTLAEAQSESDESSKKGALREGATLLKRYFWLVAFKGYLNDIAPDNLREMETFTLWVRHRLEIEHMITKLEEDHLRALQPIHDLAQVSGNALEDEVALALNNRSGEGGSIFLIFFFFLLFPTFFIRNNLFFFHGFSFSVGQAHLFEVRSLPRVPEDVAEGQDRGRPEFQAGVRRGARKRPEPLDHWCGHSDYAGHCPSGGEGWGRPAHPLDQHEGGTGALHQGKALRVEEPPRPHGQPGDHRHQQREG